MSKKGLFALLAAVVLAAVAGFQVMAAPHPDTPTPPNGAPHAAPARHPQNRDVKKARHLGQITAIGEHEFTLTLRQGSEAHVQVDADTHFRRAGGGEAAFSDLAVGQWVAFAGKPTDAQGTYTARWVIILPEDFTPPDAVLRGKITAVGEQDFSLQTRAGDEVTIQVTDQTRFRGEVQDITGLQPEMRVVVAVSKAEDGTLTALVVGTRGATRQRPPKAVNSLAGKVTAVDGATLTLETRNHHTVTVQTTEQTCFRNHDGSVQSLADIQPGAHIVVIGRPDAEKTSFTAWMIVSRAPKP